MRIKCRAEANLTYSALNVDNPIMTVQATSEPSIDRRAMPRVDVQRGRLILNADDWGADAFTTDRIHDCVAGGGVSCVSAMVFMVDSERAAGIALDQGIQAGLHLNLTTPFTSPECPSRLRDEQQRIRRYLRTHRFSQIVFNPMLASCFEFVVTAQLNEFRRLYKVMPERIDGHHHMHLCANILWSGLLPEGTFVRRSFSFRRGQKSVFNRVYRGCVDARLGRHHRLTDYFFSLAPIHQSSRLSEIVALAQEAVVEVETHPADKEEYAFLMSRQLLEYISRRNQS